MGAEKRAKVNASGRRIPMSALNNARGRRGTKERKFKVKPPSEKTLMHWNQFSRFYSMVREWLKEEFYRIR